MRWVWLKKTEPHRPLPIHVPEQVRAFFKVAVYSEVGDGTKTLFWTDRWLHGQCITDLAPRLFAIIPKRRIKQRTVQDALTNQSWISDIKGAITVGVIIDYLHLWDVLSDFFLQPDVEDRHLVVLIRWPIFGQDCIQGIFCGDYIF